MASKGIIYEYEDGGKYCGEWENGTAHGHGVCTGPNGSGLFEGLWEQGNQASGIFTWPSGQKYMGKWRQGVREGAGKETKRDGTEYCGEFTRDSRGRFGVLRQPNGVVYRGTWRDGVQDGEGTELYIDGGVYRGEYCNGLRHGHGTRSSSNYERSTMTETHSVTSLDDSVENLASALEDPSSVPSTTGDKTNAQIYEGEWKGDKRHGYGVLKIVGHHTYYGQWEDNMRSGYGVMIYGDEKRKEEGQWQRGKLVNKLKRKKLQLKSKQLETRVNQAHMNALQAAETARSKADLAEGRASTANAKARTAVRAAQQAVKDAELGNNIEKLYRNAPKIQEHAQSPVTESFSAGDVTMKSSLLSNQLLTPNQIPLTPSFEDLASIASGKSTPQFTHDSSGSSESLEDDATAVTSHEQRVRSSLENPSPGLWKRRNVKLHEKRERFQSSRFSSAGCIAALTHTKEKEENEQERFGDVSVSGDSRDLTQKRKILLKIHQATESDPTLSYHLPRDEKEKLQSRTVSNLAQVDHQLNRERVAGVKGGGSLRPRHINKATGEPDHGEVTDEEELLTGKPALSSDRGDPQTVSVEVLQQMAQWNKMVAYLNLALLFFLLVLIICVVLCMNYYWLVYQAASDNPTSSTIDIESSYLSAGHMA